MDICNYCMGAGELKGYEGSADSGHPQVVNSSCWVCKGTGRDTLKVQHNMISKDFKKKYKARDRAIQAFESAMKRK